MAKVMCTYFREDIFLQNNYLTGSVLLNRVSLHECQLECIVLVDSLCNKEITRKISRKTSTFINVMDMVFFLVLISLALIPFAVHGTDESCEEYGKIFEPDQC